jgi:hypothetical protein
MTAQQHPAGRVPGAVSELIKNALTLAEGDSRPLHADARHAIRRHLLTALRPMLGQLAAENRRLQTELEIRAMTYRYIRDEAKDIAAVRSAAKHWERRYRSTVVEARRQHARAQRLAHLLGQALDAVARQQPTGVLGEIAAERDRHAANHPDGTGQGASMLGMPMAAIAKQLRAVNEDLQTAGSQVWWTRVSEAELRAGSGPRWLPILLEAAFQAGAESDPARLRAELLHVAGVTAAWIDALDRRTAGAFAPGAAG